MSTSVTMPALGESVSEGTVTRWLKQEGDQVNADEPLLEVSTDKVDTEIPSPASGVLQKIMVGEDETVEVGAELAVIGDGSGSDSSGEASGQPEGQPEQQPDQPSSGPDQQSDPQPEPDQPQPDQQPSDQPAAPEPDQPQPDQQPSDQPAAPEPDQPQPDQQASDQPAAPAPDQPQPDQQASDQPAAPAPDKPSSGGGISVLMPALGESVSEGTVTRWLKQEGDQVNADEPLLEVSTDKVDTEIPSPASGVLQKIMVGEDETVQVGAELAVIGDGSGSDNSGSDNSGSGQQPAPQTQQAPPPAQQTQQPVAPAQQEQPAQAASPSLISAPAPQQNAPEQQAAPAPPQQSTPQQSTPQQATAQQPAPAQTAPSSGGNGDGSAYVTPLVRKLATEHGVDLSTLQGTGVGGRIRKQDVLEAAKSQQQAPPVPAAAATSGGGGTRAAVPSASPLRGTTEKMSRLRKTIARRMVESLQTSAQLTTVVEVDLTRIARLRQRAKAEFEAREGVKLSFLPFLAKATVEALKVHPRLNSSIDAERGEITYFDVENLGIAVDTERGLLVPVVREAGDLNIAGLARKVADLAARTRDNKITPDELGGGTFTLTNTGSRGALFDTPIINQPQVAILGTGAVVKRPVVIDDADLGETIAIRSMCYLALSYDHRIVDGADAARFLTTVKARLEEGAFEADLGL